MTNRRDLNQELFGSGLTQPVSVTHPAPKETNREISLSELAELSELTEEQAKVRVKVTHLATQVEALSDGLDLADQRIGKLKSSRRRINMAVSPKMVSAYKREQCGVDVI